MINEAEILNELILRFGDIIIDSRFPEPHYSDLMQVKAIYLGCDPTNVKYNTRFPYAFALEYDKTNHFKGFVRSHGENLEQIGLSWDTVYAQNLCRNYFKEETSKNLKVWKKVANEFWIEQLKEELSIFDSKIPVLLTSQYLLEVLGMDGYEKIKAPEFYECRKSIPIKAVNNILGRDLIPLYRGKSPRFKVSYHLSNKEWKNYKGAVNEYFQSLLI